MRKLSPKCLALLAVAGLLLGVFLYLGTGPNHRIGEASFTQISKGMTRQEVEAVFGVPAGNYSIWKSEDLSLFAHDFEGDWSVLHPSAWIADDLWIEIGFSEQGVVAAKIQQKMRSVSSFEKSWRHVGGLFVGLEKMRIPS